MEAVIPSCFGGLGKNKPLSTGWPTAVFNCTSSVQNCRFCGEPSRLARLWAGPWSCLVPCGLIQLQLEGRRHCLEIPCTAKCLLLGAGMGWGWDGRNEGIPWLELPAQWVWCDTSLLWGPCPAVEHAFGLRLLFWSLVISGMHQMKIPRNQDRYKFSFFNQTWGSYKTEAGSFNFGNQ